MKGTAMNGTGSVSKDWKPAVRALRAAGEEAAAEEALRSVNKDPEGNGALRDLLIGQGRETEALEQAALGGRMPGIEGLVSQGFQAFRAGRLQEALQRLQQASRQAPDDAPAHHHLGRALHNAGQGAAALAALERSVALDPAYVEGWISLGQAQRANGRMDAAQAAFRKALTLAPGQLAARHDLAITLFHTDRPDLALVEYDQLLARSPNHTRALADRGLTLLLLGQLDAAQASLERALEIDPGFALAWLYLGQLHNETTDTARALECLQRATALDPGDVEAWIELTGVYEQTNREKDAIAALRQGFAADPQHPGLHLEGAKLERRRGDAAAAVRRLEQLDPAQLTPRIAQQYAFELGLSLDRDGQADRALRAFQEGNRLARQGNRASQTDPQAFERRCAALDAWLDDGAPGIEPTDERIPASSRETAGEGLCFLVGFPRSGTTLVDTTLATNPAVTALEEAPTIDPLIQMLERATPPYPAALANFGPAEVEAARRQYAERVGQLAGKDWQGWGDGRLLIDKMPLRFMHAGLLQRLFPLSRLIFVARHPCDVVLSNFMQQYAVNETNIHFDSLAHSAQTYARIMGLWAKLQPRLSLAVETVRYEDLVEDLPGQARRLCEFLEIDASAISFDREARLGTRDRVRTSSYQQVAEPIYKRASGRWQRYRRHLEPLFPLLEPAMTRYGYRR